MEPSCATCKYSDLQMCDEGDHLLLLCRRNPPQLFVFEEEITHAFPQMTAEDWCGEFKPKEV